MSTTPESPQVGMPGQAQPPAAPGTPPASPVPPGPPGPSGAPGAPAEPSRVRKGLSGAGKRIVGGLIALAVVAGGGWVYDKVTGDPDTASVGDCMAGASANDLKTVDCADAGAMYKIVGKVENKTEAEFSSASSNVCEAFPTADSGFWKGEKGKKGYVLCLAPAK